MRFPTQFMSFQSSLPKELRDFTPLSSHLVKTSRDKVKPKVKDELCSRRKKEGTSLPGMLGPKVQEGV